jgi:ADP-ribose pyrophosphatase YjhB (NUDIX family)
MASVDGQPPSLVARAFVLDPAGRILLVANDPAEFWYTPGGHLAGDESLAECLQRELAEEVGIAAEVGEIVLVDQVIERAGGEHKVEVYFLVRTAEELPGSWRDRGGPVRAVGFFSAEEVRDLPAVFPDLVRGPFLERLATGTAPLAPFRDLRRSAGVGDREPEAPTAGG